LPRDVDPFHSRILSFGDKERVRKSEKKREREIERERERERKRERDGEREREREKEREREREREREKRSFVFRLLLSRSGNWRCYERAEGAIVEDPF
jgi:hypothetical protein